MNVVAKKASTTKRKRKKTGHFGTMILRASNAEIERSSWYAGKKRRDKLRKGLYLLGSPKSCLLDNLKSYTADIKNELNSAFESHAKYIPKEEHKEVKRFYTGKLQTSIHKAPLKIQTICFQLAMSQLEKQNTTMIEMPFTYLLTQEQVELCRNQHDRGFASRLGQRIQRKLREVLGYSPAFYFTFENPEAAPEKQTSFHDRLPHIHGALLFRSEDEDAIWQAFYDLNKADPKSVFHSREFRIHHKERKECVDALGEFDADIGWAIYQTKAVSDLAFYNRLYKIKGFEDCQFATRLPPLQKPYTPISESFTTNSSLHLSYQQK
jgi:hypothetical protein